MAPLAAVSTLVAGFAVAPVAGVVIGLAWFLALAAYYDNHTGSCLMIAVLVIVVVAILTMLIGLAATLHR